jgi:23S rRNA pseudouridine2605 synthase
MKKLPKKNRPSNPKSEETSLMRLNRFIAASGVTSRRKADLLIAQGQVRVNKKVVTELGTMIDPSADHIAVEGRTISLPKRLKYFVLNKPKDTITTLSDEAGRTTVKDYIKTKERIYPIGRLDRNTTGVLLLTNDGDLAARLAHPKYEIEREYHATLDKPLTRPDAMRIAKGGIDIGGGDISPAVRLSVAAREPRDVIIGIREGKNREVRRLFESIGYEVKKLDRTNFAGITHSGMKRGDIRPLTAREVRMLKNRVIQK